MADGLTRLSHMSHTVKNAVSNVMGSNHIDSSFVVLSIGPYSTPINMQAFIDRHLPAFVDTSLFNDDKVANKSPSVLAYTVSAAHVPHVTKEVLVRYKDYAEARHTLFQQSDQGTFQGITELASHLRQHELANWAVFEAANIVVNNKAAASDTRKFVEWLANGSYGNTSTFHLLTTYISSSMNFGNAELGDVLHSMKILSLLQGKATVSYNI